MLQVLYAMYCQPVQLAAHSDLYIGHVLVYVISLALGNAVARHNLQYWQSSHYWHAQFSLTIATFHTGYFGH